MIGTNTSSTPQRPPRDRSRSHVGVDPTRIVLRLTLPVLALAAWAGLGATSAPAATLVQDGEPAAVIVLPDDPASQEQAAADDIVEHIELMSGGTLEIVSEGEANGDLTPIRIGAAASEALISLIEAQSDDPFAFALVVAGDGVDLRGNESNGTRAASAELLEQLGVRWYMPGEIGRVVPERDTVVLDAQETVQAPSYEGRRASRNEDGQWNHRLRLGGAGRYGAHGIRPFHPSNARRAIFEENPEYLALIDGERQPRQICLTNSTDNIEENEVLQLVVDHYREHLRENPDTKVLNMGPNDGSGYCECEHCRALDPPAHVTTPLATPEPSFTDRYVWFFNHLTDALADEFPDVRIGFYAYSQHLLPPVSVEPRDNLAISLAPIHVCRIHGPNNPNCPESNFPIWAYEQWKPYAENFMADRGYMYNLAEPGMPHLQVSRFREEIPAFHALGVRRWAADPADAWASHNPTMYVAAKLLWDVDADVDAILEEFYDKFYGPASEPMAAYHTLMERAVFEADHHTGSVWDVPLIYTAEIRSEARALLEEAASLAEGHDDAYATRIAIMTRGLDFVEKYCELRALRNEFDFSGEYEAMQSLREVRDSLLEDFEYPMLFPRHANDLFRRFVETPTNRIYESVGGGEGEVVARLSYEWKFQQDPEHWGHYVGFHKPESVGGNWQDIRTDISWSNQGLRYYFGQAWYRQEMEVPVDYEGRNVNIWFAAVDNTAEVWVNGQFVGANHGGAEFDLDAFGSSFRPFQFDATDAINFGGSNVVAVRTYRPRTNELGTGGLLGPAMFYIPASE